MKAEKILSTVLTVVLAVSAWTLKEVIALKVDVAEIKVQLRTAASVKTAAARSNEDIAWQMSYTGTDHEPFVLQYDKGTSLEIYEPHHANPRSFDP